MPTTIGKEVPVSWESRFGTCKIPEGAGSSAPGNNGRTAVIATMIFPQDISGTTQIACWCEALNWHSSDTLLALAENVSLTSSMAHEPSIDQRPLSQKSRSQLPKLWLCQPSYSAAAFSDAIAALTRGITSSAINCSERFVRCSSTQSMPA